jgi:SAM-dependent methyltransferase
MKADANRLAWIYSAENPAQLRERYEAWAAHYDSDLDALAWSAPRAAAERCHARLQPNARVLDAGCGTGQVGAHLCRLGGHQVTGFDLSPAMLAQAARRGCYAQLLEGSLLEPLPFADGSFDAAVSVGVFTYAHVGPEALAHVVRAVRPGGFVVMAFRDDVVTALGFELEFARLESIGAWQLLERSEPAPMVEEDGQGIDMRVWSWRVGG